MDGAEGETHVELGARIMHVFDRYAYSHGVRMFAPYIPELGARERTWHDLCLYHSRFYAKRDGKPYSKLCVADKLAIAITPWWLYLPLVLLSGEWREYVEKARTGKYSGMNIDDRLGLKAWYLSVQSYCRAWAMVHADGRADQWTPEASEVPNG